MNRITISPQVPIKMRNTTRFRSNHGHRRSLPEGYRRRGIEPHKKKRKLKVESKPQRPVQNHTRSSPKATRSRPTARFCHRDKIMAPVDGKGGDDDEKRCV
ncbi:DNA repair metallo-beta-lactamase [Striga asiatica]|uniref:DNA repair metallo-beta-lactamase n=1 Tax=Striga asiatica TaxID=4170 RepID=A0A5A7NVT7_STRAF|nr:DNA repair metallo-beta-lactamase [Striga asiatica]